MTSYDEVILPGRAGQLIATLDTSTLHGDIGKGISITTNDRYTPIVQAVVRARILGSVELMPGYKAILSNRNPLTRTQAFLIRKEPSESGILRVSSARASVPWIDVEVERLDEKRLAANGMRTGFPGDWILRATLKGNVPQGRSQEWVKFDTGLPREPEITILIAADLHPPVNMNASQISMVAGEPKIVLASLRQDLREQTVRLISPEGLTARTEPGRRRFFKIHLEWNGAPPEGPVELRLEVGGESQTLPITVTAAD